MKIPSCFYGTKLETKKECTKVARQIWKGVALADAVKGYELIDTKEVPEECGLKVTFPFGVGNKERHFYLSWIVDILSEKSELITSSKEEKDRIFFQLLEYDWSILSLSGNESKIVWFQAHKYRRKDGRHRFQPYLHKLCDFWDILYGEGKRYISDCFWLRKTLWEANFSLSVILFYLGVPDDESENPKDPSNLRGLCEKYNLLTRDVLNDPVMLERFPFIDE